MINKSSEKVEKRIFVITALFLFISMSLINAQSAPDSTKKSCGADKKSISQADSTHKNMKMEHMRGGTHKEMKMDMKEDMNKEMMAKSDSTSSCKNKGEMKDMAMADCKMKDDEKKDCKMKEDDKKMDCKMDEGKKEDGKTEHESHHTGTTAKNELIRESEVSLRSNDEWA